MTTGGRQKASALPWQRVTIRYCRDRMQIPEGEPEGLGSRLTRNGLTGRMTMIVGPLAILSIALAVLTAVGLLGDGVADWLEIALFGLVGLVVIVAVGSVMRAYRFGDETAARITEVRAAARRIADSDLNELAEALRDPDADRRPIASLQLDTDSEDEIGALNRTFVDLHRRLTEVSSRQMETLKGGVSDLVVSLARRNTSLVNRQLALLDELEAGEDSPEVLEAFYKVDHLAARMRRNAESLLVLAGADSPRQLAEPAKMKDILRAAISEVEDYLRVQIDNLDPATVDGHAVADISHLIAELLDNGAQFSPPEEKVRISGKVIEGGYLLAIEDRGLGLSEPRLDDLNRLLASPPPLGLRLAPTMGLYVVSHLAARHGIEVMLSPGQPGLVAELAIPDAVLTRSDAHMVDLDRESQEYIYKMRKKWKARADGNRATSAAGDDGIVEPVETEDRELPTRVPGDAYRAQYGDVATVTDGASGIRSALSAYDEGRQAALDPDEKVLDLTSLEDEERS